MQDDFDVEKLSTKEWYRAICLNVQTLESYMIGIDEKLDRLIKIFETVHKDKLSSSWNSESK